MSERAFDPDAVDRLSFYGVDRVEATDFDKLHALLREALVEVNRLRLVVETLEQALEQERAG